MNHEITATLLLFALLLCTLGTCAEMRQADALEAWREECRRPEVAAAYRCEGDQ